MAPQTNIGSSTPIDVGGGNIQSDLRRKVINDAAASLSELARAHGRNAAWAQAAVRHASNLGATQALRRNVIDVMAPTLPALLNKVDGTKTVPKGLVLHTKDAEITNVDMSLWEKILDTLIDPNLIVLFMSIGTLGLIVELWNPGLIFPGTVGAVSLILGLFGLQVLPISAAGALLMLLAFTFFAAEAFVPTHGAITLAGAVCFVLGSLLLFQPAGNTYEVSVPLVVGIAVALAAMVGLIAVKLVQVRRAPVVTGQSELVGQVGVVRQPLAPGGLVFVRGELWRARANGERIEPGTSVRVDQIGDDLVLEVEPAERPVPVT
jgi:membrane-bound serine protease (ClpP class)